MTRSGAIALAFVLGLGPGLSASRGGDEVEGSGAALSGREILRRVIQNASQDKENDRRFDARYEYTERKVTSHWNGDGELKKRKVEERENRPGQARGAGAGSQGKISDKARSDSPQNRPYDKDDFPITEELVNRYQVEVRGRDMMQGRPVWVLDFEPVSPPLPASGVKERFLNRVAGRAWVDAGDFTVVRLQLRLMETLNILGGIVGALRRCEVEMERQRTEDGLYYIKELTWRIEGREAIFTRIMDFRGTIEDVRRVLPDGSPEPARDPGPAGGETRP